MSTVEVDAIVVVAGRNQLRLKKILAARDLFSKETPIVFVYLANQKAHPVEGANARDLVAVFPFSLSALMRAPKTRGSSGDDAESPTESVLRFIVKRSTVIFGGVEIALTKSEFRILRRLAEDANELVEFSELTSDRTLDDDRLIRNLRTHVSQLRAKIPILKESIVAVEGYGYRMSGLEIQEETWL